MKPNELEIGCAKGAGEIGRVPPMAAIVNAIYNASGVRIRKLPLSPDNMLKGVEGGAERVRQPKPSL